MDSAADVLEVLNAHAKRKLGDRAVVVKNGAQWAILTREGGQEYCILEYESHSSEAIWTHLEMMSLASRR